MSKTLASSFRELLRPPHPRWAVEFTSRHVIAAGVDGKRVRIEAKAAVSLPPGALAPNLAARNLQDPEAVGAALQSLIRQTGCRAPEMVVVIPDESARITFLSVENLPAKPAEQQAFVRWKLKKTVPFDVDTAQIALRPLGRRTTYNGSKHEVQEVLVILAPRPVIGEYETLLQEMDIQPGVVVPSTLAALNLYSAPTEDALFVKVAPETITTSIFQGGRLTFYRKVPATGLYDAVHPTLLYYQDKLGGEGIRQATVCAYDSNLRAELEALGEKIGIPVAPIGARPIEDLYKPALGAVHWIWNDTI